LPRVFFSRGKIRIELIREDSVTVFGFSIRVELPDVAQKQAISGPQGF